MERYRGSDANMEPGQLRNPPPRGRYDTYTPGYDDARDRDRRKERDTRDMYRGGDRDLHRDRDRGRDRDNDRDREREMDRNRDRERDWPRGRDFDNAPRSHDGAYSADGATFDRSAAHRPSSPNSFGQGFSPTATGSFPRLRYDSYPLGRNNSGGSPDDRDRPGPRSRYDAYNPGRPGERAGRGAQDGGRRVDDSNGALERNEAYPRDQSNRRFGNGPPNSSPSYGFSLNRHASGSGSSGGTGPIVGLHSTGVPLQGSTLQRRSFSNEQYGGSTGFRPGRGRGRGRGRHFAAGHGYDSYRPDVGDDRTDFGDDRANRRPRNRGREGGAHDEANLMEGDRNAHSDADSDDSRLDPNWRPHRWRTAGGNFRGRGRSGGHDDARFGSWSRGGPRRRFLPHGRRRPYPYTHANAPRHRAPAGSDAESYNGSYSGSDGEEHGRSDSENNGSYRSSVPPQQSWQLRRWRPDDSGRDGSHDVRQRSQDGDDGEFSEEEGHGRSYKRKNDSAEEGECVLEPGQLAPEPLDENNSVPSDDARASLSPLKRDASRETAMSPPVSSSSCSSFAVPAESTLDRQRSGLTDALPSAPRMPELSSFTEKRNGDHAYDDAWAGMLDKPAGRVDSSAFIKTAAPKSPPLAST
ncbi:hypothetical protein THASP1DRAFT_33806, partial [Thamnocephalis sphaerospora]